MRFLVVVGASIVALTLGPGPVAAITVADAGASSRSQETTTTNDRYDGDGLLLRGAGYTKASGSESVRELQRDLRALGHDPGPIDGLFGPRTEAAVESFQLSQRIAVDGIVGPATERGLRTARQAATLLGRGSGYLSPHGSTRVRALQHDLRVLRHKPGPIDGLFGPRTEAAVERFQRRAAIVVDGVVGPQTRRRLAQTVQSTLAESRNSSLQKRERFSGSGGSTFDWVTFVVLLGVAGALLMLWSVLLRLSALTTRWRRPSLQPTRVGMHEETQFEGDAIDPSSSTRREKLSAVPLARRDNAVGEDDEDDEEDIPARASEAGEVRVLGYVSVENAGKLTGSEFAEQAAAIDELCEREGWTLVELVRDIEPENGKGLERPGLAYGLECLASGEASCLAVLELARLTRSAAELGELLEWLVGGGIRLVVVEPGIDTATDSGRLVVKALESVSCWERERLARRTREGLAAAREKGARSRPSVNDRPELRKRIAAMRAEGMTLQAIADTLNAEGVPTLRGGAKWRPSSVQASAGYKRRSKKRSLPLQKALAETEPISANTGSSNGKGRDPTMR